MRKLKLFPFQGDLPSLTNGSRKAIQFIAFSLFFIGFSQLLSGQCTPVSSTISGHVVQDRDFNANWDLTDPGKADVPISLFDNEQNLVAETSTNAFGYYEISGLVDGKSYRLEFLLDDEWTSASAGIPGNERIQFVSAPACEQNLFVNNPLDYCGPDAKVAVSKFIQGGASENDNNSTLINLSYDFQTDKTLEPVARKSQTGSVWGLAYSKGAQKLFSSAFVNFFSKGL